MKKICKCGFESENPSFVECPICKNKMEVIKPRVICVKEKETSQTNTLYIEMSDTEYSILKKYLKAITKSNSIAELILNYSRHSRVSG